MGPVALQTVAAPLGLALGFSIAVERVLEFAKNGIDLMFADPRGRVTPPADEVDNALDKAKMAAAIGDRQDKLDRLAPQLRAQSAELVTKLTGAAPGAASEIRKQIADIDQRLNEGEFDEKVHVHTLLTEDATDPDDGGTMRALVLQILGLATGILLVHYGKLHLFSALMGGNPFPYDGIDYLLTGLLIGGGSGPVHVLLQFVSDRKFAAEAAAIVTEPAAPTAPVTVAAVAVSEQSTAVAIAAPSTIPVVAPGDPGGADWSDIPYDGGVDVEVLETIHRRPGPPNLIVYHHTTMRADSTFEDVVRVIKARKEKDQRPWVTGYHCVVTRDGVIHPFCRWDRYGNHVAGFNARSLGISFNGNFETNPAVPFSNPDGRMGPSRPSEEQLKAGARVVALWGLIYGIPIDFERTILPHHQLANKTCPGNQFPYEEFQRLVRFFHRQWQVSPFAKGRIELFKQKPYLGL